LPRLCGGNRGGETGGPLKSELSPALPFAAALGQLGRIEEAKEALEKAITTAPAWNISRCRPWVRPEDHAHMLEGLRKAGWEG